MSKIAVVFHRVFSFLFAFLFRGDFSRVHSDVFIELSILRIGRFTSLLFLTHHTKAFLKDKTHLTTNLLTHKVPKTQEVLVVGDQMVACHLIVCTWRG